MELFWDYFDANTSKKFAKDYGNVIHPSMFSGSVDEATLILLLVPPPELHLLIGPLNTMYDELSKVWPSCDSWNEQLHIKREEYHGGKFNGNDSRRLLKNVKLLEELCPPKFRNFVEAFRAFNEVVTACYGRDLSPVYKDKIERFKVRYQMLNINTTPKVHAVLYHISEFCDIKKMGLSPWSEQTAESLHQDFNKVWNNYKVRDTSHPEYAERLLQATITYNSQHL